MPSLPSTVSIHLLINHLIFNVLYLLRVTSCCTPQSKITQNPDSLAADHSKLSFSHHKLYYTFSVPRLTPPLSLIFLENLSFFPENKANHKGPIPLKTCILFLPICEHHCFVFLVSFPCSFRRKSWPPRYPIPKETIPLTHSLS